VWERSDEGAYVLRSVWTNARPTESGQRSETNGQAGQSTL